MESLNHYREWAQRLGLTFFGLLALMLEGAYHDQINYQTGSLLFAAVFLIALVGAMFAESVVDKLASKRWFRDWLWGHGSLEGTWVDVVRKLDSEEVSQTGHIYIAYEDGALSMRGSSYVRERDGSYKKLGGFESETVLWDKSQVQVIYRSIFVKAPGTDTGYFKYHFTRPIENRPAEYTGVYFDPDTSCHFFATGHKLTEDEGRRCDTQEAQQLLPQLWERYSSNALAGATAPPFTAVQPAVVPVTRSRHFHRARTYLGRLIEFCLLLLAASLVIEHFINNKQSMAGKLVGPTTSLLEPLGADGRVGLFVIGIVICVILNGRKA